MVNATYHALETLSQGISTSCACSFAAVHVSSSVAEALITAQDQPGILYPEGHGWMLIATNQIADEYLASRVEHQGERPDLAHWTFIRDIIKAARKDQVGTLLVWWSEEIEAWVKSFTDLSS